MAYNGRHGGRDEVTHLQGYAELLRKRIWDMERWFAELDQEIDRFYDTLEPFSPNTHATTALFLKNMTLSKLLVLKEHVVWKRNFLSHVLLKVELQLDTAIGRAEMAAFSRKRKC